MTAGCGRPSASSSPSPTVTAVSRSWSRTSTSPIFGGRAGRPSATAGGERAFDARSLASRLGGSATCWSAWPPTPAYGWSRSTRLHLQVGRQDWLAPLRRTSPATATVHHAAAVVIGRRGLGHNARRRPGVTDHDQRIVAGELPARPSIRLRAVGEPDLQKASGQRRSPRRARQAGSQEVRGPGGSGLFGTTRAGLTPAYLIGTVARQVQSPPTSCRPQPP